MVLLPSLLLVVSTLHLLQLPGKSLNLVFVLIDLRLVHIEFSRHCLHLVGLLLKVLLVDRQLFSDFRSGLSRKQVFELHIKLLFLLNDHIFLNDLFCLFDQSLLQGLNLLQHFPSVRVRSLKLPPSVIIDWIL